MEAATVTGVSGGFVRKCAPCGKVVFDSRKQVNCHILQVNGEIKYVINGIDMEALR